MTDRPATSVGWGLVAAGALLAVAAGFASIGLVARNALDSPTTGGWALAWLAVLLGIVGGAVLAAAGVRRLAARPWSRAVPLGLLVSVPATFAPWVVAVVAA
jgi:hypothetical protein